MRSLLTLSAFATILLGTAYGSIPRDCARAYNVSEGDTCLDISAAQKVSTFQLTSVNSDINADCTNLAIGQTLCLGRTGQDCTTVHKIVPNDSCAQISKNANIDVSILVANNPNLKQSCYALIVDQVLCTAPQVIHYTASTSKQCKKGKKV